MIDTKELRRLAQAATPGPWYVTGKLTRYVEALIDGGLIQEVAACGPTKADGGYGPQQEANARLIAAANPAVINELLDRLELTESIKASYKNAFEISENTIRNLTEKVIPNIRKKLEAAEKERDALQAKIKAMEQQEPVAFALYSGWARKAVYFSEIEACDQRDRRQLTADLGGSLEAYRVVPLIRAHGAKGEEK